VEDNVLGGDTLSELALDGDAHVLGLGLREALGGEDVLDLGRADAESEGAECTVGCTGLDEVLSLAESGDSLEVCESPQTTVVPGRVKPCSGPMMWTIPNRVSKGEADRGQKPKVLTLSLVVHAKVRQAKLLHVVLESGALCPAVRLANESGDALKVLSRNGAGSSVSLCLLSTRSGSQRLSALTECCGRR
jgi:hypothetical protein